MAKPLGLTVKEVTALQVRAAPYETRDAAVTGAYVVKHPSGSVSYILRYRYRGKKTKLTIGKFDPETGGLQDARAEALQAPLANAVNSSNRAMPLMPLAPARSRSPRLVSMRATRRWIAARLTRFMPLPPSTALRAQRRAAPAFEPRSVPNNSSRVATPLILRLAIARPVPRPR